jgi:hypothetical protein
MDAILAVAVACGRISKPKLMVASGASAVVDARTSGNPPESLESHGISGDELCANPRRFRLGGKKEAAGVCRRCDESMEFQSQTADNERVVTLHDKADEEFLSGPWPQYMAKCSVRGACGFVLTGDTTGMSTISWRFCKVWLLRLGCIRPD